MLVLTITAGMYSFTVDAQTNATELDEIEVVLEAVYEDYEDEEVVDEQAEDYEEFEIPEYVYPLVEWLEGRSVSSFLNAIRFGSSTRAEELQHSTRHTFEQFFLPMIVNELRNVILYAIDTEDIETLELVLNSFWDVLSSRAITTDLLESEKIEDEEDIVQFTPICDDCGLPKWRSLQWIYGLHFSQHFLGITIEELTEGVRIVLLDMAEPGVLQSTYTAIVYIDGYGLQVFTLERSMAEDIYAFSAVFVDYRTNLGPLENCKEAFIYAITNLILNIQS